MSTSVLVLRAALAATLAGLGAVAVDRLAARRGLLPAGFVPRTGEGAESVSPAVRRSLALLLLAGVLFVGVFQPVALLGAEQPSFDLDAVSPVQLFVLHAILAVALVLWGLLAFAGTEQARDWPSRLGLRAERPLAEVALGVAVGVGAWVVVVVILVLVSAILYALGAEELFPSEPPAMVLWIASLPLGVRLAISLSAGIVEESFFRGFLQPRVGVALSTGFFVLAHLTYEQPLMLVGIALLSLVFAGLVWWRENIWAAATAHATFDGVQLLFLIPLVRRFLEVPGGG